MKGRRTTIAALTLAVLAAFVVAMMAMPKTVWADDFSVTMYVGEEADVDSSSYGKHPDYTVTDCQYNKQIISVSVVNPYDTLHIEGLKAGTTTITVNMQYESSSYTASFPVTVLDNPLVTLSAGTGGSVSPADPTRYAKGTDVDILATPDAGYEFDAWTDIVGTDGIDPSKPTALFAMPENNVSATATFKAIPYKVTTSADKNGALVASPSENITVGTSVTLTATPAKGFRLKSMTGTYQEGTETKTFVATTSPHTFVMPAANVEVTAEFEAVFSVTVTADPTEGGTATADKETAAAGETVSLSAAPKEGYEFVRWESATPNVEIKDGKFTMPSSDVEVKAIFQKKETPPTTATLTFDLAGGTLNGKTGTYTMTATVGETIKLPGEPTRVGYTFKCWKGSEYKAGAEYEVKGDHTFTAKWEKGGYSIPTMDNSRGGNFTSSSEEITYTVSQEVPDYAKSLRTWVDLESVLYLTTDEVVVKTTDGTVLGSDVARVSIDGQRITVTVDDATPLLGKTLTFSYKAKLRSDADLTPYMNPTGTVASVPYQAHTVFDNNEDDVKHSVAERVNFRVSKPSQGTTTRSTSSGNVSRSSNGTLARTGDATSLVSVATMAAAGVGFVCAGRKRR